MCKLRYLLLAVVFILITTSAEAKKGGEEEKGYQFTTILDVPSTSIKDQYHSGTCWAFSGIGILEAELLRLGKPEADLSEMFVVWHTYSEKSIKDVRLHGSLNFSAGGAFHDVINMIRKHGIVPESVYDGLNYGEEKHVHGEMDRVLSEQVNAVIENKNKKLSTAWHDAINSTLSSYLGVLPETFSYEGKEYTPLSFSKDYIGLNMDDYVEISSYTHHPFYSKFILEVPDNWSWDEVYNVPMEEMEQIIDNSLENGYTVAWASDISEKGFSTSKKGVAVIPDLDAANIDSTQVPNWDKLTIKEKEEKLFEIDVPVAEKNITQEMRQIDFDNYQTTDDHGMLMVGTAKDQNGTVYYKIKNSWGDYNDFKGYFYASKPYVRYKTMSIMVNKDAIPKNIRKKLNL